MKKYVYFVSLAYLLSLGSSFGMTSKDFVVEKQPKKVNFFENLPIEVSSNIFDFYSLDYSQICKLIPVCKKFGEVVKSEYGSSLKINFFEDYFCDFLKVILARFCCGNALLSSLSNWFFNPKYEKFKQKSQVIRKHVGDKREISIDCSYTNITNERLDFLVKTFKDCKVITLNLVWCTNITDVGIKDIAKNCPTTLENIALGYNFINGMNPFCFTIRKHPNDSGRFEIFNNRLPPNFSLFDKITTDDNIKVLFERCKNLRRISFFLCNNITDILIEYVVEHCPRMEEFGFYGCENITDYGIRAIASSHCLNLRVLGIIWCDKITDISIKDVVENRPELLALNIAYCKNVTGRWSKLLVNCCPKLLMIRFNCCNEITDNMIKDVVENRPNLTMLKIEYCKNITGWWSNVLANGCPKLRSISFCYCDNITDAVIKDIAASCSNLRELGLDSCKNITKECVDQLIKDYPNLKIYTS